MGGGINDHSLECGAWLDELINVGFVIPKKYVTVDIFLRISTYEMKLEYSNHSKDLGFFQSFNKQIQTI